MDGATLTVRRAAGGKQRCGVQQAWLVVTTDADLSVRSLHSAEQAPGQVGLGVGLWIARDERAADAQVKDDARRCTQIDAQQGSHGVRVALQPGPYGCRMRGGGQATRVPKRRFRETGVDPGEPGEDPADRSLADRQVFDIWALLLLVRRHAGARTQPHIRQAIEDREFVVLERILCVIARCYEGSGRQRVGRIQHSIRDGNREVADRIAVDHVAKVDDAGDALVAGEAILAVDDDHVIVIGVVVYDALAQLGEKRHDVALEIRGKRVD